MEASAGFGTSQLFLNDSRLVLAVVNHLRYQALSRAFGVSRDQANVVTVALLLGAADGAYVAARRISGMRPRVSGADAVLGAIGLREAALGVAGPSSRAVPGFAALAERRVRRERIRRYAAARGRGRAATRA